MIIFARVKLRQIYTVGLVLEVGWVRLSELSLCDN